MGKSRFNPELVAPALLNQSGVAVIWQLHLAAAELYRKGRKPVAWLLIDIADAAERVWLRRSGDKRAE